MSGTHWNVVQASDVNSGRYNRVYLLHCPGELGYPMANCFRLTSVACSSPYHCHERMQAELGTVVQTF